MAFRVEITDPAIDDIDEAITFIAKGSRSAAAKSKASLEAVILSLRDMPSRYPVIPEADELEYPYRSAIHYSHRIIYRIDDEQSVVYVVRVYQGARHPLAKDEIDPSP